MLSPRSGIQLKQSVSQNPIKHSPNIHPNVFSSFCRTVIHGQSHGISTSSPLNKVSLHFTIEPLPSVASPIFPHQNPPSPLEKIHKISEGPEKLSCKLFFASNKFSFLEISFPTLKPPPQRQKRFQRTLISLLKKYQGFNIIIQKVILSMITLFFRI